VLVRVPPAEAFRIFTEEIDGWWRTGMRYRIGKRRSVVHLEPKVGGRLFESFETAAGAPKVKETGRITCFDPPRRLVLEWRAVNFAADEKTEVEVQFEPSPSGTLVTVCHRGWSRIRLDHPARHGEETAAFLATMGRWWGDLMTTLRLRAEPPSE
jgi:uncharacterized protein YndB with AHSA1/START domain